MSFWDWWWILPLATIVLCGFMMVFMMVFMIRSCVAKMRRMMSGVHNAVRTGTGMDMADCPCMAMMGRFMKSTPQAREMRNENK